MISVLGKYNYKFPKPFPLKFKLKDLLEENVDEKYYLSDKQINVSPTLTTRSGAYAAGMILVKNNTKQGYLEATIGDGIDISSRMEHHRGNVQKDKIQTLTTAGGNERGVVENDLRIRKLTPREAFRLMGVKDEDYDNVAKNQSDASLYHLAGDSIVVNVLMAIFKELL